MNWFLYDSDLCHERVTSIYSNDEKWLETYLGHCQKILLEILIESFLQKQLTAKNW